MSRPSMVAAAVAAAVLLAACQSQGPTPDPGLGGPSPESSAASPTAGTTAPGDPDAGPSGTTAPAAPSPPAATPTPGPSTPDAAPTADPELRGVWVHLFDDTLKSPGSIDRMLDEVAGAGANTVIVEVVRRQDAYYDSEVLPRTTDPALPAGFDLLAHVVEGAKTRGLDVHAWIPLAPTYHHVYDDLPAPPGWVHAVHGADSAEPWVTRLADGTWTDYLDLGVAAVRDHLEAVVTDLAARYDLDAVHLDYLRYPSADAGYNPYALGRYQQETGTDAIPTPDDPAFSAWRREQTRSLAARLTAAVAEASPGTAVSAAVIAQGPGPAATGGFAGSRAHREYYQDWPRWVQEGLLDVVMPMVYFDDAEHGAWFQQWVALARQLAAGSDVVVAPGVAGYLNVVTAGEAQMEAAMADTDGAVVYSYQQSVVTGPRGGLLASLGAGSWARPAPAPPLG